MSGLCDSHSYRLDYCFKVYFWVSEVVVRRINLAATLQIASKTLSNYFHSLQANAMG